MRWPSLSWAHSSSLSAALGANASDGWNGTTRSASTELAAPLASVWCARGWAPPLEATSMSVPGQSMTAPAPCPMSGHSCPTQDRRNRLPCPPPRTLQRNYEASSRFLLTASRFVPARMMSIPLDHFQLASPATRMLPHMVASSLASTCGRGPNAGATRGPSGPSAAPEERSKTPAPGIGAGARLSNSCSRRSTR